jgi:phage gp29-like protein
VRQDYLESDAHSLADDARQQLLIPWAWYNYGAPPEDVPEPGWDVTPPEDKDASSKTMVQVGDGLTKLVELGLGPSLDARAILEAHGIHLRPGVEPALTLGSAADTQASAEVLAKVSAAIQALSQVAPEVDRRALLAQFGVPLLPDDNTDTDAPGQIFKYHIDSGVVTVNEVRASLGLSPIPGGDVPTVPSLPDAPPAPDALP